VLESILFGRRERRIAWAGGEGNEWVFFHWLTSGDLHGPWVGHQGTYGGGVVCLRDASKAL
jgi:hypothetical protein